MLDELGLDYVEGGYPGANPLDTQFFADDHGLEAKFTAFGMTKRAGRSAANDPGSRGPARRQGRRDLLRRQELGPPGRAGARHHARGEPRGHPRQRRGRPAPRGREVLLDCEHFFDGYKANPDYALACARAAHDAGARWIVLCDTNGGTLPHEVERIVGEVAAVIPGDRLGIHAHNDTEQAVANSLAAVRAGVRQIQGTLNGLGERCGNANLTSLIPTLLLKPDYAERFEIGVTPEKLATLTRVSRILDEILNRTPDRHAPYVGSSAFATKAGIHASAVVKDPATYEHVAARDASATSARCWSPTRRAGPTSWPSSSGLASQSSATTAASTACSRC